MVGNSAGSITSKTKTLTVDLPPTITVQPQNKTVKVGKTAKFTVTATGTAPLKYQWEKNGVNIEGATKSSYTTPSKHVADNGAVFAVSVTNNFGGAISSNAILTVH